MTNEDKFVCSIEPVNGVYHWLLEQGDKVYGGQAKTQKEAMNEAFKILNAPKETVMGSFQKLEESVQKLQALIDEPDELFGQMGLL